MEYFFNSEDRFYVPILPYTLTTRPKPHQIYPPLAEEESEILIEELILLGGKINVKKNILFSHMLESVILCGLMVRS